MACGRIVGLKTLPRGPKIVYQRPNGPLLRSREQRRNTEGKRLVKQFLQGIRHGIPIGLGYISVAFTFGMMAVSEGLSIGQAVLISMTNVTSAGQFAGLDLMLAGGSMIEMALTQLTINLRYALMSLSLSQKMDESMNSLRRMIFAFVNTDEVFAVASGQPSTVGKNYLFGLILTPYLGWALGTLMGAAAGSLLPVMVRNALGIAIYGMFLAIFIPPAKKLKSVRVVVAISAILSCVMRYTPYLNQISGGFVIILCAVSASALGAWLFPVREVEQE